MATRWRTVCIVVTPGSGDGRAHGVARRLARLLRRRGSVVTIQAFSDLPSLIGWAKSADPDFSVIFCVGGDATQSAAALLARRHRIPFVPIPNGFGNLFASVFGHTSSPRRAARLLGDGEIRMVDVGLGRRRDVPVPQELRLHRPDPGARGRGAAPAAGPDATPPRLLLDRGARGVDHAADATLRGGGRRGRRRAGRAGDGGERGDVPRLAPPDASRLADRRAVRRVRDPSHLQARTGLAAAPP